MSLKEQDKSPRNGQGFDWSHFCLLHWWLVWLPQEKWSQNGTFVSLMRTTFEQSGEKVCLYYTLRQPHCVQIKTILQTKIRRSQYHWNQEGPNSSIMLCLHQMLESPNTGSKSYKKGVCEVEGSRNNEKKKIAPSSVRREKKRNSLA